MNCIKPLLLTYLCVSLVFALPSNVDDPHEENASNDDAIVPEEITKFNKDGLKEEELQEEFNFSGNLKVAPVDHVQEIVEPKVSYAGSQLWRVITYDNKEKKSVIGRLYKNKDISMWGGNRTALDILVSVNSRENVRSQLILNQINFDVVIDDVQKAIDEENRLEDGDELESRQGHRMTWSSYHRAQDIHDYVDYLAATYPSLCKVIVIGSSVQGRPLKVLKITGKLQKDARNKAIWVDGGIHAREWISPASVTYIINHLAQNMESESEAVRNLDWYFLPVANPDGYEYSHTTDRLWRKNRARAQNNWYCTGTDLNRNFGYHWGERGSGQNPCQEIYAGTGAFSEPETSAIRNFITGSSGADWKAYVSFHSYGQYILYPWGYDRLLTTDNADLQSVAIKAAKAISAAGGPQYTIGPAAATLYPASGGSDDWAKGVAKMKYAYTIELRDSGRYGFVLPASYIQPTASEALAALKVIAEAAYDA